MVKRTAKERLKTDVLRAERIRHTLGTTGWKDIQDIIQAKYESAMNDLLAKEDPEARGAITAITEIMNDISSDLQFGDAARKKYNEKYLNIQTT